MKKKYDIFISYRRIDREGKTSGRDIARTIKLELEKRGFNVFFDYSEIKDSVFESIIIPAVRQSKYFILVLSKDALVRCANSGDWVRREINEAIVSGCKIIPISPDGQFSGWPSSLPNELKDICKIHVSEVALGFLFEKSIDKLIEERLGHKNPNKIKITLIVICVIVLGLIYTIWKSNSGVTGTNTIKTLEQNVETTEDTRDICYIVETFINACNDNKPADNCFWSVFYKIDSMMPLTSGVSSTDQSFGLESMFPDKLEYKVRLTYNGTPFSVGDIGTPDICNVTLYGAHCGPLLLYIGHNYGGIDMEQTARIALDLNFKLKKKKLKFTWGNIYSIKKMICICC